MIIRVMFKGEDIIRAEILKRLGLSADVEGYGELRKIKQSK